MRLMVSSGGHLPAEVTGQDGKRYPAKRPTIVAAKDERLLRFTADRRTVVASKQMAPRED